MLLAEAGETTTFTKHRMEMETNAQQSQAGNIVVAALRPQPTLTVTEVHRPRDEDSQLHSLSKCFEKQKAPGNCYHFRNRARYWSRNSANFSCPVHLTYSITQNPFDFFANIVTPSTQVPLGRAQHHHRRQTDGRLVPYGEHEVVKPSLPCTFT